MCCDKIEQINERVNAVPYGRVFRGFVLLRLAMLRISFQSSMTDEIIDCSGVDLCDYYPQAYKVEGGTSFVNGRYDLNVQALNDNEEVAYTKNDGQTCFTIHQRDEDWRWAITHHYEGCPEANEIEHLYIHLFEAKSMFKAESMPPQAGWMERGCDQLTSSLVLTPIGLAHLERLGAKEVTQELLRQGMTEQQAKVWKVLQKLALIVQMPASMRTLEMEEALKLSLIIPNTEKSQLHGSFLQCAHGIIDKLFCRLNRKRQLKITQFLASPKIKKAKKLQVQDNHEVNYVDWFYDHDDIEDVIGIDEE